MGFIGGIGFASIFEVVVIFVFIVLILVRGSVVGVVNEGFFEVFVRDI